MYDFKILNLYKYLKGYLMNKICPIISAGKAASNEVFISQSKCAESDCALWADVGCCSLNVYETTKMESERLNSMPKPLPTKKSSSV